MKSYLQFISEAKEPKPVSHSLKKMSRAYSRRNRGVNVDATERKSGDIRLHNIFIPTSERNKGIGTRAMKGLSAIADKSKKRITLSQAPEKGKKKKLNDFYKSHGFEANKGRSRDLSVSDTHIRNPKTEK